tara:strand:+ start:142 stop:1026 length:885 start_codon:yes stop_codon:yes gene_type:complete
MRNYREDINDIIKYYSSNVSQNKISIIFILIKDYYIGFKNYLFSKIKNFKRSQKFTKERYERIWNEDQIIKHFDINSNSYYLHKFKKIFLAHSCLTTKIQQYLILSKIAELNPKTVLEIGCGSGITLKLLSDLFCEIHFSGVDQSIEGIKYAKRLKNQILNPIFKKQLNFQFNDIENNTNLELYNQDARSLNFNNKTFDVVFSNLALEQMDNIKYEVLSEIKRVAKNYLIFIEPFKNLNSFGLRYLHHKSKQYFNLNYKDIEDKDFEIIEFYDQLPSLLSLNYGMLVLKRKNLS